MADHFIDALGDFCPIPIMKVEAALQQIKPGDQIILISDHSCTARALKEEMRRKRCKVKVIEIDNGIWEITIIKPLV